MTNKLEIHLWLILLGSGPQPADIFGGWQNDCNLLLFPTTKHVFENFGGWAITRLRAWLGLWRHCRFTVTRGGYILFILLKRELPTDLCCREASQCLSTSESFYKQTQQRLQAFFLQCGFRECHNANRSSPAPCVQFRSQIWFFFGALRMCSNFGANIFWPNLGDKILMIT